MKEIFCRLNLHFWKYPEKQGKVYWVKGAHRICATCKLEQTRVEFGGWVEDFRNYEK